MRTRAKSICILSGLFIVVLALGAGCATDEVPEGANQDGRGADIDAAGDTDPPPRDTIGDDAAPDDTGGTDGTGDTGPTACLSAEDCPDGEVCRVDRSGNSIDMICGSPAGDGEVGDACDSDDQCRSNLCLDGTCTKPCERPVQCGGDGWTCDAADVSTDGGDTETINVCQRAPERQCQSDGDCAEPKRCIGRRGANNLEFVCGSPNNNGADVGESCQDDSDCALNLCVDGTCTGPCESNDHCSGADGYTCETTNVDLGNGNTDTASICVPPRPCDHAGECKVDEVCYYDRSTTSSAGFCRDPNPGGDDLGDVCQKDRHCKANLCFDSRFRNICSVPCDDVNDCKQGFRCEETDIADGQGGTITDKICVPAPPAKCDKQSDCGADETCSIVPTSDGNGLESVCIPDPGGLATGNACQSDSECKSLVCLNNHCASPCTSRDQCANDQACRTASISKQGNTGEFVVCETLPEEKCTSTGTCSDGTRRCSSLRQDANNDIQAYCQFPNGGASGGLGDSCSQNADCKSGLCAGRVGTPIRDICSVACTSDNHCATGQICTSLPFSNTEVATCSKPCSHNGDCSGNNVCMINENQLGSSISIDTVCREKLSGAAFGETCGPNTRCESGLCLLTYTFDQTARNNPCNSDADCSAGRGCHTNDNDGNDYCAKEERRCTRTCTSDSHCSGGAGGNLGTCSSSVTLTLSDGSTRNINACSQQ